MAIDTTNEKLALIEYGDVFQPGLPISADGLDQADNQQLLWGYPGVLWVIAEEPVIFELILQARSYIEMSLLSQNVIDLDLSTSDAIDLDLSTFGGLTINE